MRKIYILGAWAAAAAAAAAPVNYTLNVTSSREVDDASAEMAGAFGIPELTRTDTSVTFTLELLDGGAYKLTFVTAAQQTIAGETAVPDVEKLAGILPGRWLEFSPRTLATGGVKRGEGFVKDSEEVDYNLLAFMLFPPGGPLAAAWSDGPRSAVARVYGVSIVSTEKAEATPLPPFEGGPANLVEFQATLDQALSQSTNVSTMIGKASFEGAGAASPAPDGLTAYARLDLTGTLQRSFTIFGGVQNLSEHVSISLRLVREGYELPADWSPTEEVKGE